MALVAARDSAPPAVARDAAGDTPGLVISDLSLRFGDHLVFESLSYVIPGGIWLAVLGASGVGKSSFLKILAGLLRPGAGCVRTTGGAGVERHVAYMGQKDLLFPWLTVLQNVTLGPRLRGEAVDHERAMHLLRRVGLADRARSLPAELSGGMRQRAAIARTLYEQRRIVLMDEPFSALDAITRPKLQDLAAELLAGCTVLLITHDPMEACRLGHQLIVFSGRPGRFGEPLTIQGEPPRSPDDAEVLHTQGRLLRMLVAES